MDLSYHTLTVANDVRFDIAIGLGDGDPISQEIAKQTFSFPLSFQFLFALIQPDDTVLDLGAHIGTFSLAAASLGCRVISVEASPYNAALLQASVARNGFDRMNVVPAAISDRPGMLEFVQAGPFGFVANQAMNMPTVQVPAVTVEDLLAELGTERVDLLKMDVEGSEIAAIRGMSRLLARADAPPILYESNGHTLWFFGETPNRLIAALEAFGYQNYLVEPGRLVPVRADDLQADCTVDYLAVKQLPAILRDWPVSPPMTVGETVARVLSACVHPHEHHRAYTARALAGANPAILADPTVRKALDSLCADPHPDVRMAASWWMETRPEEKLLVRRTMIDMCTKTRRFLRQLTG